MCSRVKDLIEALEATNFPPEMFCYSVQELLEDYPEFIYTESMRGSTMIFHDLEKKVTPHGIKNSLKYTWSDLVPELEAELKFLVRIRNDMRRILTLVKAARNKKFILAVLEEMYNTPFTTGGGTPPVVQRIVIIYEGEGNVRRNKRKPEVIEGCNVPAVSKEPTNIVVVKDDCSSRKSKAVDEPVVVPKKSKNIDYVPTQVTEEDCSDLLSLFDFEPTNSFPITEGLDFEFDFENDLLDDLMSDWIPIPSC